MGSRPPELLEQRARQISLIGLFAALTAVGGIIRLPLPPVPITLQTLVVMLAGISLGGRCAALSQVAYVIVGLLGLPVFAHGGGPGYVLQPTFGYLIGFIVGAYVIGKMTEGRRILRRRLVALAVAAGLAAIYLSGVAVLYFNLHLVQHKAVRLATVAKIGFLVPLPGDLLKGALAVYLGPMVRQLLASQSGRAAVDGQ